MAPDPRGSCSCNRGSAARDLGVVDEIGVLAERAVLGVGDLAEELVLGVRDLAKELVLGVGDLAE